MGSLTPIPGTEPFRLRGGADGILMVHGFSGSPASMRPMGEWFAARGLTVSGVRLPGHGTSVEDFAAHPWPEWAAGVDEELTHLRSTCARILVLGQSMGGALAVHLAAERPSEVDGLALLSPYVFDRRLTVVPLARFFVKETKGVGSDVRKEGVDELAYDRLPTPAVVTMAAFLKVARADLTRVTAPTLVFEPGEDHAIPKDNPRRVFAGLGSARKELIGCPNSYHVLSLDHDAPMIRERVLAFLRTL